MPQFHGNLIALHFTLSVSHSTALDTADSTWRIFTVSNTLRFLDSAAIGSDRIEKESAVPPEC